MNWTKEQIEAEKAYRREERLGILCGQDKPTKEQAELARREAEDWDFTRTCKRMGIDFNAT